MCWLCLSYKTVQQCSNTNCLEIKKNELLMTFNNIFQKLPHKKFERQKNMVIKFE